MAANADGTWELIDGVQRLSTLIHYMGTPEARKWIKSDQPLELQGLKKLTAFNGQSFDSLLAPSAAKLTVNARYPDIVPLTTIPPQVLQTLPKLTEDLEYRFIGNALILLDVHAHIIADFIEDALPK